MTNVVVTGMGAVGSFGTSRTELAQVLERAEAPLSAIDDCQGFCRPGGARQAHLTDLKQLAPWLPGLSARRMSPPSKMAVASARIAFDDAGLDPASLVQERAAVALGVAFASTHYTVQILNQIADSGPESVAPFLFMESVANAHAGQVAIALGLRGPNLTVTQREASGLFALLEAHDWIANGQSEVVLAGAVDEMAPIAHTVLDRLGALSSGEREQALPFASGRDGFVASEGCALWVLESEEHAATRGAKVLARFVGGVRANDPTASAVGWGTGSARLARSLERGLARFDLGPTDFDRIVSGASGSRAGDRLEAEVLRKFFGADDMPAVLAPKATVGEYGGGFLAAALMAVDGAAFGPTPGCEDCEPPLGIRVHDGRTLEAPGAQLGDWSRSWRQLRLVSLGAPLTVGVPLFQVCHLRWSYCQATYGRARPRSAETQLSSLDSGTNVLIEASTSVSPSSATRSA